MCSSADWLKYEVGVSYSDSVAEHSSTNKANACFPYCCRLARTLKQQSEQKLHAMQHKRQQQQRSELLQCTQRQLSGAHWACHTVLS
jgi:hypothetical protein